MRVLAACPRCSRQYDCLGRASGELFHCACGEVLRVGRPNPVDAAVVRCSSCGAPRQKGAAECGFCSADFTLHERDLHTICPHCLARISDRGRFCHHCGTPILVEGTAGEETEQQCPTCGDEHSLNSRVLGAESVAILECGRCAGLWLGRETLRLLENRARHSVSPSGFSGGSSAARRSDAGQRASPDERLYRPCPVCGKLMHRRNYGRRSGVVVDTCREHGVWFDQGELARVLDWIRGGGVERSLERDEENARHERSMETLRSSRDDPGSAGDRDILAGADLVGILLDLFSGS